MFIDKHSKLKILKFEKALQRIISHFSIKKLIIRFLAFRKKENTKKFKVFVYSPGKTGSSSIHLSLSYLYFKSFKIENLQKESFKKAGSVFKSHNSFPPFANSDSKDINIYFVQFREPISRTLSCINENHLYQVFNSKNEFQREIFDELFGIIISEYFDWWDKFIIDFSVNTKLNNVKNKGYDIIQLDDNNILVFHLTEYLNNTYSKSINDLFDTNFNEEILSSVRKTKSLIDNKKYDIVKNQKFSTEFLNKTYDNKYIHLFYKNSQIESFKKKYKLN
tara:strand:- start:439 stop:1272 length:834 start_codon:yes stop_codon:yes gene_type:complete